MPYSMKALTALIIILVTLSCKENTYRLASAIHTHETKNTSHTTQLSSFIDTIPYSLLCRPIDTVNKLFKDVKDSSFESEGVEWPGKVVKHTDGSWTVFETSWTDRKNIWQVTTTSKAIKFQTPFQVGDTIGRIQKDGYQFTYNEGDGGEYFYLTNEQIKYLGFSVEEKYSHAFYKNAYEKGMKDPMKYLNPKATITELTISGDCTGNNKVQ
jgi:hypothetical protein